MGCLFYVPLYSRNASPHQGPSIMWCEFSLALDSACPRDRARARARARDPVHFVFISLVPIRSEASSTLLMMVNRNAKQATWKEISFAQCSLYI